MLVLVLEVLLEVRVLATELSGDRVGMFCLGRVVLALCRVTGLWSCVASRCMACWLEESLSMLLLVGVPVPCRRGLLSWGCIILDTTVVCFPSGRRNVAASVT